MKSGSRNDNTSDDTEAKNARKTASEVLRGVDGTVNVAANALKITGNILGAFFSGGKSRRKHRARRRQTCKRY
jgi:hypothetical protein